MSDIEYGVSVNYLSTGNLNLPSTGAAMASAKQLDTAFAGIGAGWAKSMGSTVESVGSTIIDGVTSAAAVAGGALVAGLAMATKVGIGFNATLEDATLGLATIQNMQVGGGITAGMRDASAAISQAQKDAKNLPGEFTDLLSIMKAVSPAAMQGGAGLERIEHLSAQAMAAAAAMGVSYTVAGRQMAAAIEGRATSAMAFPLRLGLDREALKKMTREQRIDTIGKSLSKADPSIALYSQSWAGLTSTAHDTGRQLAGVMTQPIFGSMKGELGRALEWFSGNEDQVNAIAARLGVALDVAFHRGLDAIKHWTPIVITFGKTLYDSISTAFDRIDPYLKRFGAMAERFMTNPNAGHMLASGLETAGAMKVGGMALGGSADAFSALLKAAPALGMSFGDLALAGGAGALALGALAVGAYGVTDILTDGSNKWHDGAVGHVDSINKNLSSLTGSATTLESAGKGVADAYGAYVLKMTDFWTGMLASADKFGTYINSLTNFFPTLHGDKVEGIERPFEVQPKVVSFDGFDDDIRGKAPKIVNHHTTMHNRIEIKVNSGQQDPSRFARDVMGVLNDVARNPKSAAINPAAKFSTRSY